MTITSKQIAKVSGKRHDDVLKDIRRVLALGVDGITESVYFHEKNMQTYPMFELTKDATKMLLSKKRGVEQYMLDELGISDLTIVHTHTRFEVAFGDMLTEALNEIDLEVIPQYNVDGYRIDFYIPSLNIAVEYDEEHHYKQINQSNDIMRQEYIESIIGARFIRCDYRYSDIKNVMKVVIEILNK